MAEGLQEMIEIQNYINGEFVASSTGDVLPNLKPATNEQYSILPNSNADDIHAAVLAAKEAFPRWRDTPITERARYLEQIGQTIRSKQKELALIEMHDCGKTFGFAFNVDIDRAAKNFEFFSKQILFAPTECFQGMAGLNYSTREPLGVCGLISPWNLPLYLLTWKVAPALAAGNCVVCKPSEFTPMTAFHLAQICDEVGLPKGVVNIVHGLGQSAGAALVSHSDVAAISFTGGSETGMKVGAECGRTLKKCSLELGGKNPGIVFADCNLSQCITDLRRACFANQGQVCLTMERLFVEASIYEKFMKLWLEDMNQFTFGDPEKSNFASLVSKQHLDKVLSYIELAKQEGGNIVYGGKRPDLPEPWCNGNAIMPTIITGLDHTSACATREVFGPFVTVIPFENQEDLIEKANYVDYGLACSIWTENVKKAHQIASKVKIGMVWVNGWCIRDLRVPFGGVGKSGIGREGGLHSLDFYTEQKNICINLS